MADRQILIQILGDSTGFSKATQEATNSSTKFGNILQGIGQGIGQAGFGLLEQGIGDVTSFLTGSIAAASADELSIAQLGATLRANVPNWNSNSAAIETYITSAEKASAFSKDDLRVSLEALVGATKNVTTAEELQTTVTNLARYAHIDLSTATTLVIKANDGVYTGLKKLGIAVPAHTDAMTALADVNR